MGAESAVPTLVCKAGEAQASEDGGLTGRAS